MDSLSAAVYACLTVALYVTEPSQVELTTHDRVRVDQVLGSGVERYGDLLDVGTNTVHLVPGTYIFRTARDAQVNLEDSPAVQAVALDGKGGKDLPPPVSPTEEVVPGSRGDGAPDHVPALTVLR